MGLSIWLLLRSIFRERSNTLRFGGGRGPEHDVCSCGFSLLPVPPRLVLSYQQDLQVSQGWTIRGDDESVILDAPGRAAVRLDDPEAAKESIRRSFLRLTDLARKRHG